MGLLSSEPQSQATTGQQAQPLHWTSSLATFLGSHTSHPTPCLGLPLMGTLITSVQDQGEDPIRCL